ncbi:MAG: methylenetetrahydrofolate reductase [NAD(P)H], partial [Myxococcales bacterium]|nr:methylenetetrahydrofolate reductase [NAD(P)H] [Myxococcales bacterium]
MKIDAKLKSQTPAFSFEFFPPKNEEGMRTLFDTVAELKELDPTYVSVTYGAGGSTRRLTVELVERIQRETGIDAMAHLTCVGATREEIGGVLSDLKNAGIQNVLALRGDPPKGQEKFERTEGGFGYANELAQFIRDSHDFCIGGACYPEMHPEAASSDADMDALKRKVDAGASVLITQLFFDPNVYLHFVERCRAAGIDVPIIAGVMPVTNIGQVKRFTAMCGASIPGPLLQRLEQTNGEQGEIRKVGVEHAILQCQKLLEAGAPGIHFYTLNRSKATREIL